MIPGVIKHESVEQPAAAKKNVYKAVWRVYLEASGGPMVDLHRSAEMVAALSYPDMEANVEVMVEPLPHLPDLHICQQKLRSWRADHYFVVAKSANLAESAGPRRCCEWSRGFPALPNSLRASSEKFCIV